MKSWSGLPSCLCYWTLFLWGISGLSLYGQVADSTALSLEEMSQVYRAGKTEDALRQMDSLLQNVDIQQDTVMWVRYLDSMSVFVDEQIDANEGLVFQATVGGDTVYVAREAKDSTQISLSEKLREYRRQRAILVGAKGMNVQLTFADSTNIYDVGFSPFPRVYSTLPDSLGSLPFDSVLALQDLFYPTTHTEVDSLGRWFRLRLRNPGDSAKRVYILLGDSDVDKGTWELARFYFKTGYDTWELQMSGWEAKLEGKHFREKGCIVPLYIPPYYDAYSFVHLLPGEHARGDEARFRLIDYPAHLEAESSLHKTNGLFLGILLIQGVYFLLLFFATRDKSYICYVWFITGLIGFTLTFGYFSYWLAEPSGLQGLIGFLSMQSCYFGLILFSYYFLATPTQRPLSRKWLRRLIWGMPISIVGTIVLILLLALIGEGIGDNFGQVIGVVAVVLILLIFFLFFFSILLSVMMAWRSLRKGYSPARFFLLSQGVLLLGVLGPLLAGIASSFIDEKPDWLTFKMLIQSLQIGTILQLSLMALGIGQKRRMLEKDKLRVEQELNQELRELNDAFSRFVPTEFLKAIGKQSVLEVAPGDGVEKEVSVLFSDIRGYTSLSEQMTPAETFSFINKYLSWVAPEIRRCGGFVNQFYGDGIMALFIEDVASGMEAAICMQRGIDRFNEGREVKIRVGIGLHSGPLMMGVIGNQDRLEAGVVADTVNTAARMEGLTKYFGANLLISQSIYEGLENPENWGHRFVAHVQVKGRQQPLAVYDFFEADTESIRTLKQQTLSDFNEGVKTYINRDFTSAVTHFTAVLKVHPEDLAAQRYLSQAQSFASSGVPDDWTGVEEMLQK